MSAPTPSAVPPAPDNPFRQAPAPAASAPSLMDLTKPIPQAPDNPFRVPLPSQGMSDSAMLGKLKSYGMADDPAVKQMIATHGVSATWDALHQRLPSPDLVQAGQQATYADTPWYLKALLPYGDAASTTANALNNSGAWIANKVGLLSDPAYQAIRQGNAAEQASSDSVSESLKSMQPGYAESKMLSGIVQQLPLIAAPEASIPDLAATLGGRLLQTVPKFAEYYGAGALAGGMQQGDPAHNMLVGGAVNTVLPGVAGALGKGIGTALNKGGDVANFIGNKGANKIAGGVLRDVMPNGLPQASDSYVQGFKPMTAMLSKDPRAAALENSLVGKTLDDPIIAQRSANNTAAVQALNNIRPNETVGAASTRAQIALQGAHDAALAQKNDAWGAIDPMNNLRVPVTMTQNGIAQYIQSLSPTSARMVPPHVGDVLNAPSLMPVNHLIDSTLDMGQVAQQARVGGDARGAMIAGKVKSALDNALNSPDVRNQAGAFLPKADSLGYAQRIQDARDLSGAFYDRFGNPVIQPTLSRFESVAAKQDPSQVLDKVLADGSPEDVNRLSHALGNSTEGRSAVMSWFTNKLMNKSATQALDMSGNPMVSAFQTGKMLDQAEPLLRKFATVDQYGLLQKFRNSVEANNYAANVKGMYGNSATAPLLNTGNALFDRAAKILGGNSTMHGSVEMNGAAEAGAAVGAAIAHAPGAAVGSKLGSVIDRSLANALRGKVSSVNELLAKSMADPELARLLMREAAPSNAAALSTRIAARLHPISRVVLPIAQTAAVHGAVAASNAHGAQGNP